MTTIKTTAIGELRTKIVHMQSGTVIYSDAPVDNKGKGEMFSPTDLLAASLGSCMITIMDIAGKEHGFSIEGAEITITKVMSANPRKVAEIIVNIDFPKDKTFSQKQKLVIEHISKNCPVALSLHPELKQTVFLNFS